jgi:hypothetical protein
MPHGHYYSSAREKIRFMYGAIPNDRFPIIASKLGISKLHISKLDYSKHEISKNELQTESHAIIMHNTLVIIHPAS